MTLPSARLSVACFVPAGLRLRRTPRLKSFARFPRRNVPLCLVLDVRLGGMSGLDLQRMLSAEGSTLPVIVVTAHDDPEHSFGSRAPWLPGLFEKALRSPRLTRAAPLLAPQQLTVTH